MHLNHPLILHSILFKGDVLIGPRADNDEALEIAEGGCDDLGLVETAWLFSYVWFVMGPSIGRTLFSLLEPLIPAASTRFVTRGGNGMCLFSVGDLRKPLIINTPYDQGIVNNFSSHYLI